MPYQRHIRRMLSVTAIATAAASLAACDVVINSMDGEFGGGRAKAESAYSKSFKLDGAGAALEVINTNGKIEVEAIDGTSVELKATIVARGATEDEAKKNLALVELKDEAKPGQLRIEAKQARQRVPVEVRIALRVPKNVKVSLHTVNGMIEVVGIQAGLTAETTNGGVKARGVGSFVNASTTNGGLTIEMTSLGPDGVKLETTNGGIELSLPASAKASLSAHCVNGGISVSDLAFEKDATSNRRHVEGTINGGGAPLKLETVNGGVRVKLAGAATKDGGKG
jgi:DUF4097 and DUF4098 domain-containing protein YvlB